MHPTIKQLPCISILDPSDIDNSTMADTIELPAAADMHVHLRDGELMKTVVPTIRQGGVNVVYVMVRRP